MQGLLCNLDNAANLYREDNNFCAASLAHDAWPKDRIRLVIWVVGDVLHPDRPFDPFEAPEDVLRAHLISPSYVYCMFIFMKQC